jgi:uncharacterized protein YjbI with pentapeptide repeats
MAQNIDEQLLTTWVEELERKQQQIAELLLFAPQIDIAGGVINFVEGEETFIETRVLPLGSWGQRSGSWLWAWANPSMAPLQAQLAPLKALGETIGKDEFRRSTPFPAAENDIWRWVAVACRTLEGVGVYKASANDSDWYFLIRKLTHLKPQDQLLESARRGMVRVLLASDNAATLNFLRKRFPEVRLHLIGLDLRGEPAPWAHDLHAQAAVDFGLVQTRKPRDLSGADLSQCRLDDAILRGVTLCGASFAGSSLVDCDLSNADVRGASFQEAFLNGANFTGAQLAGADFGGAELARTLFGNVDLSGTKGLESVHHTAPSEISLSTLIASQFKLTPVFLRKAGVSRGLIEDFARGKRFAKAYQTCFLSYSSKDKEFSTQLYESLIAAGVRVFWDRFDVIPGETLEGQILEAIREHDRLLIVLSKASMASPWVKRELELAWYHKRDSLLPIRLCPIEDIQQWNRAQENLPDMAATWPILDFSIWRDPGEYSHALSLLLKSFSGGADFSSAEQPG